MNRVTHLLALSALLCLPLGSACDDGETQTPQGTDPGTTFADNTATPDPGPPAVDPGGPPDPGPAPDPGAPDPGGPDLGTPVASCAQANCDFPCADYGEGKGYGESCAEDSECRHGYCMLPDSDGNITNSRFGFCTRGCDCGGADSQLTDQEKLDGFLCLYVSGNQGRWKHVVKKCGEATDCLPLDTQWNACHLPDSGGVYAVCHAE